MLGLNPRPPRFVREYAHLGPDIEAAVTAYAADVRSRRFPGKENVYSMPMMNISIVDSLSVAPRIGTRSFGRHTW